MNESTLGAHLVVFLGNSLSEDAAHSDIVTNHRYILQSRDHHISIYFGGRHFIQRDLIVLLQPLNSSIGLLRFDVPTVVD